MGNKRTEERRWRVVLVPTGPGSNLPEEGRRLYHGPRDRALEYYEYARQGLFQVPDGASLLVTDGVGEPVYAS